MLLADEEFQDGIFHFDLFGREEKRAFIKRYGIRKEEFHKARAIVEGLSFKEIYFSEEELNYLWKRLELENAGTTLQPKLQNRNLITWISRIAAVLFIPLLITSIWLIDRTKELEAFKKEKIDRLTGVYNMVSAPNGGKVKAILPDGSEVWLNSGSSIQYPVLGNHAYREVKLKGEGLFKVTKDPDRPMFVITSGMKVKVYGTIFNINAYDDNPDIETALVEGSISITKLDGQGHPENVEYKMKPGEVGRLDRQNNVLDIKQGNNMEVFTGWVSGKYVFRNAQFKDILRRLERIHNVQFVLEDKAIGDYCFDATFGDQNIDRIMEIFEVSLPIRWRSVKAEQNNDKTFSTRRIIISRDKSRKL